MSLILGLGCARKTVHGRRRRVPFTRHCTMGSDDENAIAQTVADNNFQIKFKLHQIEDQIARSPTGSDTSSALSMELTKLRDQLDFSDSTLQRMSNGRASDDGPLQSLSELQKDCNERRVRFEKAMEQTPEDLPKENVAPEEVEEDEVRQPDRVKIEWIQASPKKNTVQKLQEVKNDLFSTAVEQLSQKPTGEPFAMEPEKVDTVAQEKEVKATEEQERATATTGVELMEPEILKEELEAFDMSIETSQLVQDTVRHELESQQPEEEQQQQQQQQQPVDAFDTSRPPHFDGFSPLKPASSSFEPLFSQSPEQEPHPNGGEPHFRPVDPEPKVTTPPPSQARFEQEDRYRMQQMEEDRSPVQQIEEVDHGMAEMTTEFYDPFTIGELDIHTKSLVNENKSLRQELNALKTSVSKSNPNSNIMDLYNKVDTMDISQLKAELLKLATHTSRTNVEKEILTYSNNKLRAQRNDLLFKCQYQRQQLETFHEASTKRLQLLHHIGAVRINDETSVMEIMAPSTGPRRRVCTFRGVAWMVISTIRLRNRFEAAQSNLDAVRSVVH